jgi:hypothetical protein
MSKRRFRLITTNADRAQVAAIAVSAYFAMVGGNRQDTLPDLLGDIMHYADVYGLNFDRLLERARGMYTEEKREDT